MSIVPSLPIVDKESEHLRRLLRERDRQLGEAEARIADLEADLVREKAKSKATERGAQKLRQILSPLHQGLGLIFGELDEMGIEETSTVSSTPQPQSSRTSEVWESWKSRLGEGPAKVIDALLLHGAKNTQQLAMLTGYHRTTIPAFIFKLNKAGLLNKSGGVFSLKEL